MTKPQLTIDQLKNYLGTGLLCMLDYGDESYSDELVGVRTNGDLLFSQDEGDIHTIEEIKPVCYRLSDLDKFIPELGFMPLEKLRENGWSLHQQFLLRQGGISHASFDVVQQLFQWHFWPFGDEYFEAMLVIDKLKG